METRDGLAHSDALDDCTGPIDILTDRAKSASRGVALAAGAYFQGDDAALEAGLAPCRGEEPEGSCGWMTYNPPCEQALLEGGPDETCCTKDNDYCDTPWLKTAKKDATGPYLGETLSCVATSGSHPLGSGMVVVALFAALRFMRRRSAQLGLIPASLLLHPGLAEAAVDLKPSDSATATEARPWFAAVDAHITLFNDVPNASLLNVGRGGSLRGGYRWGQWAFVANVGLDYWLATEVTRSLELGSLNIGIGAEHTFADDFLRTGLVIGPSILLLDTPLDQRGSIGAFAHFRPLGARYQPHERLRIIFDPLSVAYVAPVLGEGPTIQRIEYRTDVGLEFSW